MMYDIPNLTVLEEIPWTNHSSNSFHSRMIAKINWLMMKSQEAESKGHESTVLAIDKVLEEIVKFGEWDEV